MILVHHTSECVSHSQICTCHLTHIMCIVVSWRVESGQVPITQVKELHDCIFYDVSKHRAQFICMHVYSTTSIPSSCKFGLCNSQATGMSLYMFKIDYLLKRMLGRKKFVAKKKKKNHSNHALLEQRNCLVAWHRGSSSSSIAKTSLSSEVDSANGVSTLSHFRLSLRRKLFSLLNHSSKTSMLSTAPK